MQTTRRSLLTVALHVSGLWAIAVAHPLLDVLGRSPAFFVAHGFHLTETVLFLAALVLAAPLLLALAVWTAGLAGKRAGTAALALVVALMCGVLANLALKHAGVQTWILMVPAAALGGLLGAAAYLRYETLRTAVTVLSIAVLVVPLAFVARPGIRSLLKPAADQGPDLPSVDLSTVRAVPIVLIVADEVPLVSLLDAHGEIDAGLYPHVAALARDGRWFRNATTVSDYTSWAVPAILTGMYPTGTLVPTAADHPDNLFVLLARTHRLRIVEAGTELCPRSVCVRPGVPWRERVEGFTSDLRIIALHILLTDDLRVTLPPLTGDWANFDPTGWRRERRQRRAAAHARRPDRQQIVRRFIAELSAEGGQPAFYYLHSLLTHWPHRFLPGGQRNATAAALPGEVRMGWTDDEWAVAQHQQRHLLNLRLFDGLLGQLLGRLRALGLYERALIVLTSDHGTAFQAGGLRRGFSDAIAAEVMRVPLIVKLPSGVSWTGDGRSAVSRNVETIDVAPTVADVLGIDLPWKADGSSLLDPAAPPRPAKRILVDSGQRTVTYPPDGPDIRDALRRRVALFGGSENPYRTPRPARFGDLVGRAVADLATEGSRVTVSLENAARFENVDPGAPAVPFDVSGTLSPAPGTPASIAVAINGTIHAVTRTWATKPDGFMATPTLEAWRPGRNVVEVFLIEGGSSVRLRRVTPAGEGGADRIPASPREGAR